MYYNDLLTEALEVWCPTFPRRHSGKMSNTRGWGQKQANSHDRIIRNLNEIKGKAPGFVSVYSFPNGHTSESSDNIPRIDTLMFDLDFDGSKDASESEWKREMTALLVRTRMVAKQLIEDGLDQYWRASLSGHKGIHLYVDFPAIDVREGKAGQFRNGVEKYTNDLLDTIQSETGLTNLDDYVDVMSGEDFARMTRLPNTVHEGATERFGETRFCVPITIKELAEIRVNDYVELTRKPRHLPDDCRRVESQTVHDVLVQDIRMASAASWGSSNACGKTTQSIKSYSQNVNEGFTLKSLRLSKRLRPCCWRFYDRDDKFDYGQQSHVMELNCIAEMIAHNMPVDLIVSFFEEDRNFNEEYTRNKIDDVIAYDYSPFRLETLRNRAGVFF